MSIAIKAHKRRADRKHGKGPRTSPPRRSRLGQSNSRCLQQKARGRSRSGDISSRRRRSTPSAESHPGGVVSVVGFSEGYIAEGAARAALEKIHPPALTGRFLQTWNPDTRQLAFGCGDGRHGVLVHSGGSVTVATTGIVSTRFSKMTIERLSKGDPQVSGRDLLARIESLLRAFVHFEDDRLYTFVALWTIGTYFYLIFSHYGYLFLHSVLPRSGKTRLLEVNSHLAFEASQPLNAPTTATIRETAAEGRTLQLDTLERWKGKSAEAYSAAMELLDAGFRNGGVVQKMVPVDGGGWRKESYPVYAPYAMAAINRDSLTDTALDRAFVIEMHRKSVKVRKRKY
jgi:hypothetical protein